MTDSFRKYESNALLVIIVARKRPKYSQKCELGHHYQSPPVVKKSIKGGERHEEIGLYLLTCPGTSFLILHEVICTNGALSSATTALSTIARLKTCANRLKPCVCSVETTVFD